MSWRIFIVGLLAWLLLPTAVIGGAALYVLSRNEVPQAGLLTVSIEPAVAFVHGDTVERITFEGTGLQTAQREPPLDIIFAIDVSSSVQNTIGELTAAVQATARGLSRPGSDAPRYALVAFSDQAESRLDWTSNEQQLAAVLGGLMAGGGTRFSSTEPAVEALLRHRRAGARTALIVYTDGDFQDWPLSLPYGARMRQSGLDLFVVGTPNTSLPAPVFDLVGDPQRALETRSVNHLALQFQQLKSQLISGVGFDARLRVPLDGRHFAIASASSGWGREGNEPVAFLGTLSQRRQEVELPLQPLSFGLWRVGTQPPRLTYADASGIVREEKAERRPLILVLSRLLLLLAYLPAGLWTLFFLWTRPRAGEIERQPLPPIPAAPPPRILPEPGVAPPPRSTPVPTLVIGLGESGRRCLEEFNRHVARRGETSESLHVSWLSLDVDLGAAEEAATKGNLPAVAIPPLAACQLQPVVIDPGPLAPHLSWFPKTQYRDAPRASLSVERGCSGDRRLGRLALFEWLARGDLQQRLDNAVTALAAEEPVDGPRQVLVFGSAAGGFAGGALIDLCRLVRRSSAAAAGRAGTPPDIIPMVLGSLIDADSLRSSNRKALVDELETARLERAYPPPTVYPTDPGTAAAAAAPGAPFDWVFWTTGDDDADTIAQAAALGSVLTDAQPRGDILAGLTDPEAPANLPSQVNGVYVRLNLLHDLIAAELFLRIIGPEVVADIEPAPAGGYQPKPVPPRRADELLRRWAETEDGASPWGRLLRHAAGMAVEPLDALERDEAPELTLPWLREAAAWSFNRLLDGRRSRSGATTIEPTTSEEAAVLHLLAARLAETATTAVERVVVQADTLPALAQELAEAARGLDAWLAAVCAAAGDAALTRQQAAGALRETGHGAIRYLDAITLAAPSSLQPWIDEALRQWLPDAEPEPAATSLREYLHLLLLAEDQRLEAVLRVCVGAVHDWRRPDEALARLRSIVGDVARGVGPSDIAALIATIEPAALERLAAGLRHDRWVPWRSFVVMPRRAAGSPGALDPVLAGLSQRAGAGPRIDVDGDDRTGLTRLVIAWRDESLDMDPPGRQSLPYAQLPDVAAEKMRLSIQRTYEKRVPKLPPLLRLALARGDAFQAFAAAYRSGRIVRQRDGGGLSQWFDQDSGAFLTATSRPTLAEAAARFTCTWSSAAALAPASIPAAAPASGADETLLAALRQWQATGRDPDGNALVQAAIACAAGEAS